MNKIAQNGQEVTNELTVKNSAVMQLCSHPSSIEKLQRVLKEYLANPSSSGQIEQLLIFFNQISTPSHPDYDENLSDLVARKMGIFNSHFNGLYYSSYIAECYANLSQQLLELI